MESSISNGPAIIPKKNEIPRTKTNKACEKTIWGKTWIHSWQKKWINGKVYYVYKSKKIYLIKISILPKLIYKSNNPNKNTLKKQFCSETR